MLLPRHCSTSSNAAPSSHARASFNRIGVKLISQLEPDRTEWTFNWTLCSRGFCRRDATRSLAPRGRDHGRNVCHRSLRPWRRIKVRLYYPFRHATLRFRRKSCLHRRIRNVSVPTKSSTVTFQFALVKRNLLGGPIYCALFARRALKGMRASLVSFHLFSYHCRC